MTTLKLTNVNKSFADVQAVDDLSLQIDEGQVFGLLGPNGAGKTTAIRMIMEIILPDSGVIEIFGKLNSRAVRDQIGYLPEERGLYKKLKVIDTIAFFAEIKKVPRKEAIPAADEWLHRFELAGWRDKKVEELSRGMQQKLQFICTILHKPKLIILDEPFTGLDPVNTNLLKDVMMELKNDGTTIIFSTHLMEQVEKLCESICLIDHGKNLLHGSLTEIKKQFGQNRIRMGYDGKADFLEDKSLVAAYDDYGQYVEIQVAENVTPQQVLAAAVKQTTIKNFEIADPSLNEIFIQVVKN
ncbi:MAG: ATP-binding cassette domain-containing protein [Actinobacteria bacterium]|nr:ATP-binding cassette domain-containing protein [Actinomycetota bacterium]